MTGTWLAPDTVTILTNLQLSELSDERYPLFRFVRVIADDSKVASLTDTFKTENDQNNQHIFDINKHKYDN